MTYKIKFNLLLKSKCLKYSRSSCKRTASGSRKSGHNTCLQRLRECEHTEFVRVQTGFFQGGRK